MIFCLVAAKTLPSHSLLINITFSSQKLKHFAFVYVLVFFTNMLSRVSCYVSYARIAIWSFYCVNSNIIRYCQYCNCLLIVCNIMKSSLRVKDVQFIQHLKKKKEKKYWFISFIYRLEISILQLLVTQTSKRVFATMSTFLASFCWNILSKRQQILKLLPIFFLIP